VEEVVGHKLGGTSGGYRERRGRERDRRGENWDKLIFCEGMEGGREIKSSRYAECVIAKGKSINRWEPQRR